MEKLKNVELKDKLVLDAGTGACGMTKFLEKRGAEVVSIDIDEDILKGCRSQTEEVQFFRADLSDLKFLRSNTFDHVICNFLMSALSQNKDLIISTVIREFYRVLKDSGTLAIIDYYPFKDTKNPAELDEVQVELWRLENASFELIGEGHLEEISPEKLNKELKELGFHDIETLDLTKEVHWPTDLLRSHEQTVKENINRLEDQRMKEAFENRLEYIMKSAEESKVFSGGIYEIRAYK